MELTLSVIKDDIGWLGSHICTSGVNAMPNAAVCPVPKVGMRWSLQDVQVIS